MYELKTATRVIYFIYPVVALIGLIFNVLSFFIFSRKKFKNTVFWIYFRFLIIFDCLTQFLPVNRFLELGLDIKIRNISNFLCKFRFYYVYSIFPVSGWTLAFVSIDRFVSITFPNRFTIRKTVSFQIFICIIIMTFNLIYYSPNLFFYLDEFKQFDNDTNRTVAIHKCNDPGIPLELMHLIGSTLAPFITMILFTTFTLISIFNMRKTTSTSHQQKKSRSKDKRFAFITISLNFVFLAFNIPYGIFANISDFFEKSDLIDLIMSICLLLIYANFSTTFFINFLVNSMFSNEFKTIFFKRTTVKKLNAKSTMTIY